MGRTARATVAFLCGLSFFLSGCAAPPSSAPAQQAAAAAAPAVGETLDERLFDFTRIASFKMDFRREKADPPPENESLSLRHEAGSLRFTAAFYRANPEMSDAVPFSSKEGLRVALPDGREWLWLDGSSWISLNDRPGYYQYREANAFVRRPSNASSLELSTVGWGDQYVVVHVDRGVPSPNTVRPLEANDVDTRQFAEARAKHPLTSFEQAKDERVDVPSNLSLLYLQFRAFEKLPGESSVPSVTGAKPRGVELLWDDGTKLGEWVVQTWRGPGLLVFYRQIDEGEQLLRVHGQRSFITLRPLGWGDSYIDVTFSEAKLKDAGR